MSGDVSHHEFSGYSTGEIRAGRITHHLDIDFWKTAGDASLKVSNIKVYAGGDFKKMCPGATPI
jgi:hypothetical protein